ncbi:TPA: hypothetical protein VEO38_002685 [Providencia alcalifaciens]|nr:hypothetical protein [Providencia alcalifaciens]
MKINVIKKKTFVGWKSVLLSSLLVFMTGAPSFAKTVTVMNGRGLIGVYGEYNTSLTGTTSAPSWGETANFHYVQFYNNFNGIINYCVDGGGLVTNIDGVRGMPIAGGDMIMVPEFVFVDERRQSLQNTYIDTITGHFNGWGSGTNEQLGTGGCLWSPNQSTPISGMRHSVTATGRMLIYGTGNQRTGTYRLADDIGIVIQNPRNGTVPKLIVGKAENIVVTVSGLTCTLNTPSYVNFGSHSASSKSNELLSTMRNNMSVQCDQIVNKVAATISLSGNVKPQYYAGNNLEVNLLNTQQQPGAYVKMYVMVNGNKTPITLDQKPIDLAKITAQQTNVSFNNELVYELYSRGNNVAGKVNGSAELSIIMR